MSIVMPKGFSAAGVVAGIKKNGRKDLGLLASEVAAQAAGMFTTNVVKAAPVVLDMQRIRSGKCRAVIVNSGNANCCTGEQGMQDAAEMARLVSADMGIEEELVQVASTGVIGEPLKMEALRGAIPGLVASLRPEGIADLAEAIMTTDTVPKIVTRSGKIEERSFTLTGVAKGAGMIRPDMATMLCFVCTDAAIPSGKLQRFLSHSVAASFNRITIDGDTSTNDTVLLLANGLSGAAVESPDDEERFQQLLDETLLALARMLVSDGEGVTKLVEVCVTGAENRKQARRVADTIAHSMLVKTALFGEDANWGRILAAAGRSGAQMELNRTRILFNDVVMFENGSGCGKAVEKKATEVLKTAAYTITVDMGVGTGEASVLTCDLSIDYVKINADYRT